MFSTTIWNSTWRQPGWNTASYPCSGPVWNCVSHPVQETTWRSVRGQKMSIREIVVE